MNHVKKKKQQVPGHFRYLVLGTNQISNSVERLLNQSGGFPANPEFVSPITGTFLGALDRILEVEKNPLLVFYDNAGALLLPPLERNFSLDPRILWTPLSGSQETCSQAIFQLRKQWILGTELTNTASQFEHLFQSGPHFRFLLDPKGIITKSCSNTQSLLGDRAQPGEMIQDLDDYPPGILGDFLDRARVLNQIQGEFVLTLPTNPIDYSSVNTTVNKHHKKKLRIRSQFEFIGESGPYDPQGYYLVTWYDISNQVSELKALRRRIEQESMLSMIASRFIPFSKDIEPLILRTLEDLSTFIGFGSARLLPVQTKPGNLLAKYCKSIDHRADLPRDLEPITRYFMQKGRSIDPIIKSNESTNQGKRYLYGIWVPSGLATILEISVAIEKSITTTGAMDNPDSEQSSFSSNQPDNPETSLIIRMATEMLGLFFARLDPEFQITNQSQNRLRISSNEKK
jgi:hypothetical protein